MFLAAEHFTRAPQWEWWILAYFVVAGIAGGSYVIGAMLRFWGGPEGAAAARIAFIVSLVAIVLCPVFLTVDLGRPERFWHMAFDTGAGSLAFKWWSPMSVGSYALFVFGLFAFVSAADGFLALRRGGAGLLGGPLGAIWTAVGAVFALFIAAYTGVLLSVSNQPVWSDGWPLGGVFLASGLAGAAALLVLLSRWRRELTASTDVIEGADRAFGVVEAVLIVVFLLTVGLAGTLTKLLAPLMLVLWLLVLAGLAAPFMLRSRAAPALMSPLVVLLGVIALRAVVIFGAQAP